MLNPKKLMARGAWVHELYAWYYSDLKLYQDRSTFFPGDVSLRFGSLNQGTDRHTNIFLRTGVHDWFCLRWRTRSRKVFQKSRFEKKISLQLRKVSQEKEKRTEQRQNWQIHDLKSSNPVPPSTLPTWGTRLIRSGHPRVSIHLG